MTAPRETDRLIKAFLAGGQTELPDRAYDAVRSQIDDTRQRVVIGPWREEQMSRFATFAIAAAAVVLIAVIGIRFLPTGGGVGAQPTPTSTIAPPPIPSATPIASAPPTPSATPPSATAIADPGGRLQPGIAYVAHPFDTLLGMDARGFSFEVPSANWEAAGDPGNTIGLAWNSGDGESGGVGIGFLKVLSLNSDACHWTTDDDIEIGPAIDDLIEALAGSTNVGGADEQYSVLAGNVMGTGVTVTMPATLQEDDVECDETDYRIWNAEGFDIHAQGPSNIWRVDMFDDFGERYIVLTSFMPDTPDEVVGELERILRSVHIDPEPGCSRYDHSCN